MGISWTAAVAAVQGRWRALLRRAWPIVGLAVLTVVFHASILFSAPTEVIATADIGFYFEWLHEYARDHFLSGRLPLWNPYNYCGTPFAANPQAGVFYPLSWIYLVVEVIEAHKVMIALHSFLAGSFMYLFLRSLGPSRLAATGLLGTPPATG